ncbi:UNVERIFIED_CONTAM: Pre-cleavage factor Im subunit [Sesamum radiatum]|uniref:Pre-cleavage factor Im subunit n=1 Tax=Sesamum radiatum TaxID=300843 RepID=A0AAW2TEY3_SESRA
MNGHPTQLHRGAFAFLPPARPSLNSVENRREFIHDNLQWIKRRRKESIWKKLGEMVTSPVVNTYPLSSYTFGTKEPKMEKDTSVADRLARMKVNYMKEGMRTSVEGILLKNRHILKQQFLMWKW